MRASAKSLESSAARVLSIAYGFAELEGAMRRTMIALQVVGVLMNASVRDESIRHRAHVEAQRAKWRALHR